jgi:hypothetical protein
MAPFRTSRVSLSQTIGLHVFLATPMKRVGVSLVLQYEPYLSVWWCTQVSVRALSV